MKPVKKKIKGEHKHEWVTSLWSSKCLCGAIIKCNIDPTQPPKTLLEESEAGNE